MLTKLVSDEYRKSWFLDDYKASSEEEANLQVVLDLILKKSEKKKTEISIQDESQWLFEAAIHSLRIY